MNLTGTCRFSVIVMHERHSQVYGANLNSIDERIKPERIGLDMKMLFLKTENMLWFGRIFAKFHNSTSCFEHKNHNNKLGGSIYKHLVS